MYLFLRDTEVFLEYKDTIYKMQVAEVSASATIRSDDTEAADFFSEDRYGRAVIFEKNPVDFSLRFAAHTSNALDEELFLSPKQTKVMPFNLYLKNKNCVTYRILNCHAEQTNVAVSPNSLVYLEISGTGADMEESKVEHHHYIDYTNRADTFNYLKGSVDVKLDGESLGNIQSCNLTKQVDGTWVDNNNLYLPRDQLFFSNTRVFNSISFAGNVVFTSVDRLGSYSESCGIEFVIDNRLYFYLYPCAYTTRFETGDLYRVSMDYKLVATGSLTSETYYNELKKSSC